MKTLQLWKLPFKSTRLVKHCSIGQRTILFTPTSFLISRPLNRSLSTEDQDAPSPKISVQRCRPALYKLDVSLLGEVKRDFASLSTLTGQEREEVVQKFKALLKKWRCFKTRICDI